MSLVDDEVNRVLSQSTKQYIDQINNEKVTAQNAIDAKARGLDNLFSGFLTGALPPAQATTQAGVTIRDSSAPGGVNSPEAMQAIVINPSNAGKTVGMTLLSVLVVWFLFFRKKRR